MARNTDGSTTVGNTRGEGADVGGFVLSAQSELVVLTIDGNMLHVLLRKLLDGILNNLHSSWLAHGLGGIVGVAAGTVPITIGKRLGVERDLDAPFFGDTDEEEASHPEVVTHRDTLTWADLEFPLGWHNFGVDTRNVNTGIHAGAVMRLDEVTCKDLASSYDPEKVRIIPSESRDDGK